MMKIINEFKDSLLYKLFKFIYTKTKNVLGTFVRDRRQKHLIRNKNYPEN